MPMGPLKILVLSTFDGSNANVIRDFLFSFKMHSRHDYYYIFDCRILNGETDFSRFDVILIFWSVYLFGSDLGEAAREKIRKADALKILFLQDEYRNVRPMNHIISRLGIQVMFTCVAEQDHEVFYPRSLIPSLEATYTVLPGYVPAYLENAGPEGPAPRPLDIGYRSRAVPYCLGDLGQEKSIVAERFQAISLEQGFRSDISVREADRIYGQRWLEFLRSCRCVLGSASGASVIDFTGKIRSNCEHYLELYPTATYVEVKRRFFAEVDWTVIIDTVSPRIFEAAGLGCAQVLHEGGYAGLLKPDAHYICVRRDYSNIGDVIDRVKDAAFCRQIAGRTYRDLILSGMYGYRAFAERFDGILAAHIGTPLRRGGVSPLAFYARNYLKFNQSIIPSDASFIVLPSRKVLHIPHVLNGRGVLSAFSRKGWFAFKTCLAVRPLRDILLQYLRSRGIRGNVSLYKILNDLLKLDIVRRARAGVLEAPRPFGISLAFDADSGRLTLTSAATPAKTPAAGPRSDGAPAMPDDTGFPPSLAQAFTVGGVRVIVWDHSGLGHQITYATGRSRCLTVGLGERGVHRFEALAELARRFPHQLSPPLVSILRGDVPSPRPGAPQEIISGGRG